MLVAVNERSVGLWARGPDVRIGAVLAAADGAALVACRRAGTSPYPVDNAYDVLKELAKTSGESSFTAPKNGFAVYSTEHPTNVYLAYPGSDVQIEVYDPRRRTRAS
jgi:hypothetical protein